MHFDTDPDRKRASDVLKNWAQRNNHINAKYASEFFAELFPGKKASKRREKFLSALKSVQDCLGDLNDITVHEDRITAIANESSRSRRRRGNPKRAFAAGLLTGREDARLDTVLQRATDAHAALTRIKPFWR